jgi:hypothetical protein
LSLTQSSPDANKDRYDIGFAAYFKAVESVRARFIQVVCGRAVIGEVTDRYRSVTNSRIDVASAIGGCDSASQIAATATIPKVM